MPTGRILLVNLFTHNIGKYLLFAGYILATFTTSVCYSDLEGRISEDVVHSQALEGNRLGDSPDRNVLVYLPPSYDDSLSQRYPVIYILHGNGGHNTNWINGDYQGMNIKSSMDQLISAKEIKEMIIVMPEVQNRYLGSHYVNSSVTGNWADYITKDLVQYIDSNYRSIPKANSRGLSGHSMGGRGTLYLAMSYPGIYGAIYGLSSGEMNFSKELSSPDNPEWWTTFLQLKNINDADDSMKRIIGLAVAFTPNLDRPPFYADFQYELVEGKVKPRINIWQKWSAFDPVALVPTHTDSLRQLRGIKFDSGVSDEIVSNSRAFAKALTTAGIQYSYEEYEGNHYNRIRKRIETRLLPFFSKILSR